MSRRTTLLLAVVALLVAAFAAVRILDSEGDNRHREERAKQEREELPCYELTGNATCEVLVEFGNVNGSHDATYDFALHNNCDTPIVLLDYEATCRCVWLDMPRRAIAPGECCELRLHFDPRGEWGSVGNYLSISTSREDVGIAVWMSAEVTQ